MLLTLPKNWRVLYCNVLSSIILVFFLNIKIEAQILKKEEVCRSLISGLHSGGSGANYKDPVDGTITKHSAVYFEPYLGYFFNRNFGVGAIFGYNRLRSTFAEDFDLFDIGGFARYYIPVGLNTKKSISVLFLTELSYRFSNYEQINSSYFEQAKTLSYDQITFTPIGAEIKIFRGLYGEISSEWIIHSINYSRFSQRIGLEYHFGN